MRICLALSHLLLAENEEVMELAAMVMDKMLFTMAVNSFKGCLAPHTGALMHHRL